MRFAILIALCLLVSVRGHPYYRDYIPNGYAVFNPCGANFWEAVGHYDPLHHTVLKNPFGMVGCDSVSEKFILNQEPFTRIFLKCISCNINATFHFVCDLYQHKIGNFRNFPVELGNIPLGIPQPIRSSSRCKTPLNRGYCRLNLEMV